MISLLCQKSCGGTIDLDRKAIHLLRQSIANSEDNENDRETPSNRQRPYSHYISRSKTDEESQSTATVKNHFGRSTNTTKNNQLARPSSCVVINFDNKSEYDRPERKISAKKLQKVQEWLNEQIAKKNNYANSKSNGQARKVSLHQEFKHKLNNEHTINTDIEQKLAENEILRQRKRELIYKDWLVNVRHPIQREINKNLNSDKTEVLKMRRDLNYIEYLEQVNQRGCAFQDDYNSKEYDPLSVQHLRTVVSAKLKDSTNVQIRKADAEKEIVNAIPTVHDQIKSCLPTLFNNSRSRTEINWNNWNQEKFRNVLSAERVRSTKKCNPVRNKSKFAFEWSPQQTNENISAEKRISSAKSQQQEPKAHQEPQVEGTQNDK